MDGGRQKKMWTASKEEKVRKIIQEAKNILEITHFRVKTLFLEEEKEDPFEVTTNDVYYDVVMTLYRGFTKLSPEEQLERVVHGFIYAILAPVSKCAQKIGSLADVENAMVLLAKTVVKGQR